MNHEIKFRAWDKQMNLMRDWDWITRCEYPLYKNNSGVYFLDGEAFSLMQFTGICDRNGKEIYESDIVITEYQTNAIVVWDDEVCGFCTETIDGIVKGERMYCMADIIEIIGNVYENPGIAQI